MNTNPQDNEELYRSLDWLRRSARLYLQAKDDMWRELAKQSLTHALERADEAMEGHEYKRLD